MSIEAMKLALKALEYAGPSWAEARQPAAEALRAAIEQAEKQEPVAWFTEDHREDKSATTYSKKMSERWKEKGWPVTSLYTAPPQHKKLWLWKNFVDGRPEYWAFDNPYPTSLDNGDPQTLGQPCGYAIFKESRDGSCGRTEEQVLREMKNIAPPQRSWHGLTDEEIRQTEHHMVEGAYHYSFKQGARWAEAKLKEKNSA